MMKRLVVYKILIILALCCVYAQGQQFTNVSATIQDGSGQVWSNAIIIANLIPAFQKPGPPVNQGHPITDNLQYAQANGSGVFTLTVDDNTFVTPSGSQWAFSVCSNTSAQCNTITLTVSGASMDLSAAINAAISNPIVNAVPTILRAYNGVEATGGNGALYWRTSDNTLWGCFALPNQYCSLGGGTWEEIGGGGGSISITATSPIIVTPSPIVGTGVISCPSCITSIPTTYLPCQTGIGDGSNTIPAGTYHQVFCKNDSGNNITIHGISCLTDNNGTSTLNAVNQSSTALLTGAITCTNSFANGTLTGATTLTPGGWINFTFVSDGTTTQTTWTVH